MTKAVQRLRLLVRPFSKRLKLDWLPALRRSRAVNLIRAARARTHLVVRPGSVAELVRLGDALLALGAGEEGYRRLQAAADIDPERLDVRWRIATTRYTRGDYDGAMRAAASAIETQWALAEQRGLDTHGVQYLGTSWSGMIGHLALLDVYAKLALLAGVPLSTRVLLVDPALVANPAYLRLWRSIYPAIVDDPLELHALAATSRYLEEHFTMLKLADGRLRTLHQAATEAEERWRSESRGPLLQPIPDDEVRGWDVLERLGVPRGVWFVGLHVREGGPPWRDIHNGDIDTYAKAIETIAERGGWVVRMGNPSMHPLPRVANAVDYAHSSERSDWMDVFIWSRCRFFIGVASGPVGVPPTFGIPCVQTNWAPLGFRHWFNGDLVVPKLYERDGRLLGFRELLSGPIGWATNTRRLRSDARVTIVDNKPDEIADVVAEMLDRLEGSVRDSPEDDELQERLDQLQAGGEFAYRPASRVGRAWLRAHADLLD